MSGVSGLLVTVLRASSPPSVCVPRLVHFHHHNSIIINIALITIFSKARHKKRIMYGQANRKRLPSPPPLLRSAFSEHRGKNKLVKSRT